MLPDAPVKRYFWVLSVLYTCGFSNVTPIYTSKWSSFNWRSLECVLSSPVWTPELLASYREGFTKVPLCVYLNMRWRHRFLWLIIWSQSYSYIFIIIFPGKIVIWGYAPYASICPETTIAGREFPHWKGRSSRGTSEHPLGVIQNHAKQNSTPWPPATGF